MRGDICYHAIGPQRARELRDLRARAAVVTMVQNRHGQYHHNIFVVSTFWVRGAGQTTLLEVDLEGEDVTFTMYDQPSGTS